MRLAYINRNVYELETFCRICKASKKMTSYAVFQDVFACIPYMEKHGVDILFLSGNNGFDCLKHIKSKAKKTAIVWIADGPEYAMQAYEEGVFGYIVKPYDKTSIENQMTRLCMLRDDQPKCQPRIHTFGRFDIFIGEKAIHFSNKKSKELLALLVDRCGGSVSMEQVIDMLWEDRPYDSNTKALYRIALKNLRDTLAAAGCSDIMIEARNQRSLDTTKVACDYYDFLEGKASKDLFDGEYMTDYAWGEYTLAKLMRKM